MIMYGFQEENTVLPVGPVSSVDFLAFTPPIADPNFRSIGNVAEYKATLTLQIKALPSFTKLFKFAELTETILFIRFVDLVRKRDNLH